MFDDLYITKLNYVYNKSTYRLFEVDSTTKGILNKYEGEIDFICKNRKEYDKFIPILSTLKSPQNEEKKNLSNTYLPSLHLIVFNGCNLNCRYCYAHGGTYDQKEEIMDFNTAKTSIDLIFQKYPLIRSLYFFGGEPFLCEDLIDQICLYLKSNYSDRFIEIKAMSNLYELSNKMIKIIKEYNIGVTTSLDGDEMLNSMRVTKDGGSSFQKVVENINRLYDITKQPEGVEITLSKIHSDAGYDKERSIALLKKYIPVDVIVANYAVDYDYGMNDITYSGSADYIALSLENFLETGVFDTRLNNLISVITGKGNRKRFCMAGEFLYTVFQDGNIYPCHLYALDNEKTYLMGNVNSFDEEDFFKVREKIIKLNSKSTYPQCKSCCAKIFCSSCIGSNLIVNSEIPHDNKFCDMQLSYFDELIELYAELHSDRIKWDLFKKRMRKLNR